MSNVIRIFWMYPDILNLHGDRGNLQALAYTAGLMGLKVEIEKVINPQDAMDLDRADLLVFNPGELKVCDRIARALEQKKDALDAYFVRGGAALVIGTSGTVFGKEVTRQDGSCFSGLGYLDVRAKERRMILGNDLHAQLPDGTELMGSQIQMAEYTVAPEQVLARVVYGHGNKNDGTEGAKSGNLIWTNLLGPVLVKNPWWAAQLLGAIAEGKGMTYRMPGREDFKLEYASLDAVKAYIELKKEKKD